MAAIGVGMKRSYLRRKPQPDPVTATMRRDVLLRDRQCVRETLEPGTHECRDAYGTPHRPDDLDRLTLDHVHEGYGKAGKRAPSNAGHLVSVDFGSHLGGWSTAKANRMAVRDYIEGREDPHAHHVDRCSGCPPLPEPI